jgi:hypothetical protein
MDYCFNSYYKEVMHPFVDAIEGFLEINAARAKRSAVMQPLLWEWRRGERRLLY